MRSGGYSDWSNEGALEMVRNGHSISAVSEAFQVRPRTARARLMKFRLEKLEGLIAELDGRIRFLEARLNGEELSTVKANGYVMPSQADTIINLARQNLTLREICSRTGSSQSDVIKLLARAKSQWLLDGATTND